MFLYRTNFVILEELCPEAVTQSLSLKRLFLKVLQNAQENICVGVSSLRNLPAEARAICKTI